MTVTILSNALFTKTQQRVLGLLYGAPGKRFYTNEIVRIAAVGRGTVTRELVKLTEAEVLTVSAERNQKHYQANPDCLIYAELVKIAGKLFEVEIPKPKKVVKAKPKAAQKPVEKSNVIDERKLEEAKSVITKKASKPENESRINITVDDEGQMGFF